MLEAFFQKESRIRKIHMGPLGNQIDELAVLLKERGYSRLAAQEILLTAGELNNYLYARQYSFFEQPYAKYQATDTVLAKLDAIKKKCHS